jgi:hypothetical protein
MDNRYWILLKNSKHISKSADTLNRSSSNGSNRLYILLLTKQLGVIKKLLLPLIRLKLQTGTEFFFFNSNW